MAVNNKEKRRAEVFEMVKRIHEWNSPFELMGTSDLPGGQNRPTFRSIRPTNAEVELPSVFERTYGL